MAAQAPPCDVQALASGILAAPSGDPHAVFSLAPGASVDAFKARYRELAKALHPDKAKFKAAEDAFKGALAPLTSRRPASDLWNAARPSVVHHIHDTAVRFVFEGFRFSPREPSAPSSLDSRRPSLTTRQSLACIRSQS